MQSSRYTIDNIDITSYTILIINKNTLFCFVLPPEMEVGVFTMGILICMTIAGLLYHKSTQFGIKVYIKQRVVVIARNRKQGTAGRSNPELRAESFSGIS
jgi:hypothetical protein